MKNPAQIAVATALLAATAIAQGPPRDSLLFTTLKPEATRAPLLPALHEVEPQDVMVVTPGAPFPVGFTAEKFLPHDGCLTMVGDHDGGADYWEALLSGQHDAIMTRPNSGANGPSARELYWSPAIDIQSVISAHPTLRMGDVSRIQPGGQIDLFLHEPRVRAAFGIQNRINVDAVEYDDAIREGQSPPSGARGTIYLSLEEDHTMTLWCSGTLVTQVVQDGAILGVQVTGFDANGAILGQAFLIADEPTVDQMVINSGIADHNANQPQQIGDTDGLTLDFKTAGTNSWSSPCARVPHLMFCGEALTGAGVLSTRGTPPGSIAMLNGAPLGFPGITTGEQVGLDPRTHSLNGLELDDPVCHFVCETPTPVAAGGTVGTVEVGGCAAPPVLLLSVSILGCPAGGVAASLPFANPCFPEAMWPIPVVLGPIAFNAADQTAQFNFGAPVGASACLVFQAAYAGAAGVNLSTPVTVTLTP